MVCLLCGGAGLASIALEPSQRLAISGEAAISSDRVKRMHDETEDAIAELHAMLDRADRIVSFTGAGISTAKAIATRRDDMILDERRRQAETAAIPAPTPTPVEPAE